MSTTADSKIPATSRDVIQAYGSAESELAVFVLFTSIDWTLKAMEKAREMARPCGAKVEVVAVQVVPFPLQFDEPHVPMEFVIRRFKEKLGDDPGETEILVCLCRDPIEGLKSILSRDFPIVIGVKERWWATRNQRLTQKLRGAGYNVISVNVK